MVEKFGKKTKELMIGELKDVFSENKGFILSSVENIKASEMDKLRKKMRQSGTKYMVLKNRLADIALKEAGIEELSDTGKEKKVLGIGVINEDPVLVAKLLAEFSKKNKGFVISKGYLEGQVMSSERVTTLAELPGREQLLGMLVGIMNAPVTSFVGVLSSILKSLVYALNAVKEKKEQE